MSLNNLGLYGELKTFVRNQLPVARRSLGSDHHATLQLNLSLILALSNDPEHTRDDPRLNQHSDPALWRPIFDLHTGDDLLEALTITQDMLQRRRRVFGRAHPETRRAEATLEFVRAKLAPGHA